MFLTYTTCYLIKRTSGAANENIFMKYFIIISYILISHSLFASALKAPLALVYKGPGVCFGCAELTAKHIRHNGFRTKFIKPGELTDNNFSTASLYVQPGGSDNIEDTLKALHSHEIDALKKFIHHGGIYLGICAGAYMAGQFSDEDKAVPAFGLIPSTHVEEELDHDKGTLVPIKWGPHSRWIYAQSPPYFSENLIHNHPSQTMVIARYADSGRISALITRFGNGLVGLIGPHPEANLDWYLEDKLDSKHGYNSDLLDSFIQQLKELKK